MPHAITRPVPAWPVLTVRRPVFEPVSDRRVFHPSRVFRPAVLVDGRPVRRYVVAAPRLVRPAAVGRGARAHPSWRAPRLFELPHKVSFPDPVRTLVCVRRGTRREVLHALKYVGRGSGGGRKRRNELSEVTCR